MENAGYLNGITNLSILIQNCPMFKLTVSDKRSPTPESIILAKDVELTSCGTINSSGVDFLPSGFRLINKEIVIYIDPIVLTDTRKADYIFLTHAHLDHFSIKDIKKIVKPETVFICPKRVSRKLSKYNYEIREVKPGDILDLNNIKCEALAAYNLKPVLLWLKAHPKSRQNVGYILTLNNNIRIYHAGDTDFIPEMNSIKNITIALVPIGGDNLTMNVEDASRIINEIRPDIAVPMHYEVDKKEDLMKFKVLVEKEIKVKVIE
jgi:L-ascorbate metabolism protein UlaG (beta-lactamase superfamily)